MGTVLKVCEALHAEVELPRGMYFLLGVGLTQKRNASELE